MPLFEIIPFVNPYGDFELLYFLYLSLPAVWYDLFSELFDKRSRSYCGWFLLFGDTQSLSESESKSSISSSSGFCDAVP